MKLIFDHRMFRHINQSAIRERGSASRSLLIIERLLQNKPFISFLWTFERGFSFLLSMPIPRYSSLIYAWITNARGLPHFLGNYLRALYYRPRLGHMDPNVFKEDLCHTR